MVSDKKGAIQVELLHSFGEVPSSGPEAGGTYLVALLVIGATWAPGYGARLGCGAGSHCCCISETVSLVTT